MNYVEQSYHYDVINGSSFCVTVSLCGESTGHRWIPLTKGQQHGPLMFLCCQSKQNVEQTLDLPVIRNAMTVIWRRRNVQNWQDPPQLHAIYCLDLWFAKFYGASTQTNIVIVFLLLSSGCGSQDHLRAHRLLDLRAFTISTLYINHIFQHIWQYIICRISKVPFEIPHKYLTHTYDMNFIRSGDLRALRFKSS